LAAATTITGTIDYPDVDCTSGGTSDCIKYFTGKTGEPAILQQDSSGSYKYGNHCGDSNIDGENADTNSIYSYSKISIACVPDTTAESSNNRQVKSHCVISHGKTIAQQCKPINGISKTCYNGQCITCINDTDCMTEDQKAAALASKTGFLNTVTSTRCYSSSSIGSNELYEDLTITTSTVYKCEIPNPNSNNPADDVKNTCSSDVLTKRDPCPPLQICNPATNKCEQTPQCQPATAYQDCSTRYGFLNQNPAFRVNPTCLNYSGNDLSHVYYNSMMWTCAAGMCSKIPDPDPEHNQSKICETDNLCKGKPGSADCAPQSECTGTDESSCYTHQLNSIRFPEISKPFFAKIKTCSDDKTHTQYVNKSYSCQSDKCELVKTPRIVDNCTEQNKICSQPHETSDATCVDAQCNSSDTVKENGKVIMTTVLGTGTLDTLYIAQSYPVNAGCNKIFNAGDNTSCDCSSSGQYQITNSSQGYACINNKCVKGTPTDNGFSYLCGETRYCDTNNKTNAKCLDGSGSAAKCSALGENSSTVSPNTALPSGGTTTPATGAPASSSHTGSSGGVSALKGGSGSGSNSGNGGNNAAVPPVTGANGNGAVVPPANGTGAPATGTATPNNSPQWWNPFTWFNNSSGKTESGTVSGSKTAPAACYMSNGSMGHCTQAIGTDGKCPCSY